MRIVATSLPGVLIVEPTVHRDERGYFLETWHARRYAEAGVDLRVVQDNQSRSRRGTLRGLHAQIARPQGKLVRATLGEIYDVAVDIRQGSPHFGRHVGVVLSATSFRQLWVPEGFAHGFCVLSEEAEIQYKCSDFYDPTSEITVAWDDPTIAIAWPVADPTLSSKDRAGRRLADFTPEELPRYSPAATHTAQ